MPYKDLNKRREASRRRYANLSDEQRQKIKVSQEKYKQSEKGKKTSRLISRRNYLKFRQSENWRRIAFANRIKRLYNISVEEYAWILYNQNFKCAICNNPFNFDDQHGIHIDHNHITNEIRGLLCPICNRYIIGNIEIYGISIFKKSFEYLGLDL